MVCRYSSSVGSDGEGRLPDLVDAEQVAHSRGVSEEMVYALARTGDLCSVSIGRRLIRFHPDDVSDFVDSRRVRRGSD